MNFLFWDHNRQSPVIISQFLQRHWEQQNGVPILEVEVINKSKKGKIGIALSTIFSSEPLISAGNTLLLK